MSSELLLNLQTTAEQDLLQQELILLSDALFKTPKKLAEVRQQQVRAWVDAALATTLQQPAPQAAKALDAILQTLHKLPVVKLVIAFEPTPAYLRQLHDQLLQLGNTDFQHGVLLDLEFAPESLGGASITYQGRYLDFTLRSQLERAMQTQLAAWQKTLVTKRVRP